MTNQRFDPLRLGPIDPAKPLELAPGVWWVGSHQNGDSFQAHTYLIADGDQSVLVDPGGRRTWPEVYSKVCQVVPFAHIRYFICQHQDPDITASLVEIDPLVSRDDACIVTHWRAQMLMKEYGLKLPFLCVEKNGWRLNTMERELKFVFTPYAHFPGAFCTFDETSGILFSSDLFGGFTDGFKLFAEDESHFEAIRPFHEHYIPSNEVLVHAVEKIRKLPLALIAPQHGRLIPGHLAPYIFDRLSGLDCGLFLLAHGSADIHRLTALSKTLREFTRAMVLYRDFTEIVEAARPLIRRLLPLKELSFLAFDDNGTMVTLTPENRYHSQPAELPPDSLEALLPAGQAPAGSSIFLNFRFQANQDQEPTLAVPLDTGNKGSSSALALLTLQEEVDLSDEAQSLLMHLSQPLQVAIEREMMLRNLDQQREQIYQRSIRDPLTGLFNRNYMQDMVQRLISLNDRNPEAKVAAAVMDVDHFKSINDRFGHNKGDAVLKLVAKAVMDTIRDGDLAVRIGGEEFAIFSSGPTCDGIGGLAERLRRSVEGLDFSHLQPGLQVTTSLGIAMRKPGETMHDLIGRADEFLYVAKKEGRNRVCGQV
ncbi:Diguanylate cyclase (GGDEF) domain-containing protein [Rhodospirillaceae bacterium LM-1]|nr:Diguanylate cyclase (GGDEF) domain-containing protein [Rhodospirillaceae bacterium LM-1]